MVRETTEPIEASASQLQTKPQWRKYLLFVFVGFLLLGTGVVAGYWYVIKKSKVKGQRSKVQLKTENLTPTILPTLTPTPTPDPTAGWKVYRNEKYGFEIKYPPEVTYHLQKDAWGKKSELPRFYFAEDINSPGLTIRKEDNPEKLEVSRFVEEKYQALLKESEEKNWPPPQKLTDLHYLNINGIKAYQGRRFAFDRYER